MKSQSSLPLSRSSTLAEKPREITHEQSHKPLDDRPLFQSRAKEGAPAFRHLNIGKARIEGTLSKVVYCNFKEKPVCLVVIDLDFEYHRGCVLKEAEIRLTIETESQGDGIEKAEDGIQSVSSPKAALRFGPRDHFGLIKNITSHHECEIAGGHVGNQFVTGPEIKVSRRTTDVQESRWQVQGRAERESRVQKYKWLAFGNSRACRDVGSDKAFPRKLSVWMVVEHENKRFHADIEVAGKRHGNWFPQSWSRHNDQRGTDRMVFDPAPSTKILDINKLSQLMETRNRFSNTPTTELDLESCFATETVPSSMRSEEELGHGVGKQAISFTRWVDANSSEGEGRMRIVDEKVRMVGRRWWDSTVARKKQ